jgi:hypothetical protein
MDLAAYELLELGFDGGIQVSKVRHPATGEVFQIHAFHGEMRGEFDRLCREAAAIPPEMSRIVEITRDENSGYVRTMPLPGSVGIQDWVFGLRAAADHTQEARVYRLALQLAKSRE